MFMKKSTIKSFLLLALLLMGAGSSWADGNLRTLASQDYSTFSVGSGSGYLGAV